MILDMFTTNRMNYCLSPIETTHVSLNPHNRIMKNSLLAKPSPHTNRNTLTGRSKWLKQYDYKYTNWPVDHESIESSAKRVLEKVSLLRRFSEIEMAMLTIIR
jgi:hypothetical protein